MGAVQEVRLETWSEVLVAWLCRLRRPTAHRPREPQRARVPSGDGARVSIHDTDLPGGETRMEQLPLSSHVLAEHRVLMTRVMALHNRPCPQHSTHNSLT